MLDLNTTYNFTTNYTKEEEALINDPKVELELKNISERIFNDLGKDRIKNDILP